MKWSFKILTLLSIAFTGESFGTSFYGQHEQGWFWYKQDKNERPEKSGKRQDLSDPSSNTLTYREKIKRIQEEFEEATAKAILNPTLANVQQILALQRRLLDRSTQFQERWMQATLFEGQHERAQDQASALHRQILYAQKEKELHKKLRLLAKETGLFFLFKGDCPYCHAFAPTVKSFAQEYGFEVKAVSGDGGSLKEFPDAVSDNGIERVLNPQGIYPALFLAHPSTGRVIPVAWGMTPPAQLLENFSTILTALEGGIFHGS